MVLLALAPPTTTVRALDEDDSLKVGLAIVSSIVVLLVASPEVPVTRTGYIPEAVPEATLNVSPSVVAFTAANADVTPTGSPDTARLTRAVRATGLATLMSMGRFHPSSPTLSVSALAEAARLKLGLGMVSAIVVALVALPEVPVIVIG
jgi:hypothetical protein